MKEQSNPSRQWLKWTGIFLLGLMAWIIGKGLISALLTNYLVKSLSLGSYVFVIHAVLSTIFVTLFLFLIYQYLTPSGFATFGIRRKILLREVGLGISIGFILGLIAIYVIIPSAGYENETIQSAIQMVHQLPFVNILAAGILLGGIVEELFFRGHIIASFRRIRPTSKLWLYLAVVISAGLFALVHDYQGSVGMAFTFLTSFLYAYLFISRKSIIASMAAHGTYDAFVALYIKWYIPIEVLGSN